MREGKRWCKETRAEGLKGLEQVVEVPKMEVVMLWLLLHKRAALTT